MAKDSTIFFKTQGLICPKTQGFGKTIAHKNKDCARFALVLDTSGSMKDHRRLDRVKQSASDWINFDVQNGSSVAIVTFA